jgi:hypothetical protein
MTVKTQTGVKGDGMLADLLQLHLNIRPVGKPLAQGLLRVISKATPAL